MLKVRISALPTHFEVFTYLFWQEKKAKIEFYSPNFNYASI